MKKTIYVRLHLDNEADQRAWDNLQLLCKQQRVSANQGVILALLACQEGALPICIAREQEQRIVQQVTETVVNALQKSCSAFINESATVLGLFNVVAACTLFKLFPDPIENNPNKRVNTNNAASLATFPIFFIRFPLLTF